jgi:hypothetical protein
MELGSSWETFNRSTTQEWNPNVHFRVHKNPPVVLILSEISPVRNSLSYFSKIHFNITSPLRLYMPSGPFPSGFPTTNVIQCL